MEGPPCPEEMEQLVAWSYQLFGRSGTGFDGVEPLSHREVQAWADKRDICIQPHEVEALMELDGVLREKVDRPQET